MDQGAGEHLNYRCSHSMRRRDCKNCSPKQFCNHKRRRRDCNKCTPQLSCAHRARKRYCSKCAGVAFGENKTRESVQRLLTVGDAVAPALFCHHEISRHHCVYCSVVNLKAFLQN